MFGCILQRKNARHLFIAVADPKHSTRWRKAQRAAKTLMAVEVCRLAQNMDDCFL